MKPLALLLCIAAGAALNAAAYASGPVTPFGGALASPDTTPAARAYSRAELASVEPVDRQQARDLCALYHRLAPAACALLATDASPANVLSVIYALD